MADNVVDNSTVDNNAGDSTTDNNAGNSIDYGKIEQMISKGTQQKESAILKSYFQQQGMTEDEVKSAITSYKSEQAKKAEDERNALINAQKENEALKMQILKNSVNTKATSVALDMGVDKNTLPYLLKMADLSNVVDEKGEVAEDMVKNALEQVLKDIPALKASNNSNTGFQLGADNNQAKLEEDVLRRAAGLKPKK